ncbi:hypothetical protein BJ165DRAFT_1425205 [Panaeolus papilionaceus]|nr:hypothetical protein BJ165DRAFT_1425205 [Panaeolus papilionaceus]
MQWAEQSQHKAGYNNRGWPGCCRPPTESENDLIPIADWRAVNIVHGITIPQAVQNILSIFPLPSSPKSPTAQSQSIRSTPVKPPNLSRRNTGTSTPTKQASHSSKPINTPSPSHGRGRSPYGTISSGADIYRSSSSSAISSSVPNSSPADTISRRKNTLGGKSDRIEGSHSSNSSPSRRSKDSEGHSPSPRRVSSVRRPHVTPATASVSVSKISATDNRSANLHNQDVPVKRRSSISGAVPASTSSRPELPPSFITPRKKDEHSSASSSSGSSDGGGSLSDSTVTSDGGFTDYLSDESEAELQRQAEAKAALVQEELEFKIARQQLASVGLRPPKSWNATMDGSSTSTRSKATTPITGTLQSSRHANLPPTSFGAAATAIVNGGQTR